VGKTHRDRLLQIRTNNMEKEKITPTPSVQVKNVYQKLSFVRAELVKRQIKKSGKNTYSNFIYYELGDFLPHINELNNEVGLMTRFNISPKSEYAPERAVLEVINVDKPEEKIIFDSETANVQIGVKANGTGGADPIQNLGGKITYMRRYLMMSAYEIGEADEVDAAKEQTPARPNELSISLEQFKYLKDSKTLTELSAKAKGMREKLGQTYYKSIAMHYARVSADIEKEEKVKKEEVKQ